MTKPAVWTRLNDWSRVVSALGDLLQAYDEAPVWFSGGHMHAYSVKGAGYSGDLAILFEEFEDMTMRCTVLAFRGEGVTTGLDDLAKLLKNTPARRLELNAESFAHVVLYRRAGFGVDACRMGMDLSK